MVSLCLYLQQSVNRVSFLLIIIGRELKRRPQFSVATKLPETIIVIGF